MLRKLKHISHPVIVLLLSLLVNYSFAASAVQDHVLLEQYINSIQSIKAEFEQRNNYSVSSGQFLLQKPGRLKLRYNDPENILILLNRGKLTYYDFNLQEYTKIFNQHPVLELLTKSDFKFSMFDSYDIHSDESNIWLTVEVKDKEGIYTTFDLLFAKNPLQLIGFSYADLHGNPMHIDLKYIKYNVPIPKSEFEFRNPRFAK